MIVFLFFLGNINMFSIIVINLVIIIVLLLRLWYKVYDGFLLFLEEKWIYVIFYLKLIKFFGRGVGYIFSIYILKVKRCYYKFYSMRFSLI